MKILFDRLKYGKETKKDILYANPFSYGKITIDQAKCNGCSKCVQKCAVRALSMMDNKAQADYKKCIYCGNCIDSCENDAIEMTADYKMASINEAGEALKEKIYQKFKRSLVLRSVDTGSCNACMLELSATQNTFYDLSRFGISFAASPRHADGIVVTGPVTINMREALLKTYYAMPKPRLVIALGSCGYDNGIFKDGYGTSEKLSDILPIDLLVSGCPPSPQAIIYGLLKLLDKI